jgi:hypothetical protein
MTRLYQNSDQFSPKYRPAFQEYLEDKRTFSKKKGLYEDYFGESKNSNNKVFRKYRC